MERGYMDLANASMVDLPAAAGTPLEIDATDRSVVAVAVRLAVAAKVVAAASSAAAVTALAAGSHMVLDAGVWEIPTVGTLGENSLYLEVLSGSAETDGIAYALIYGAER